VDWLADVSYRLIIYDLVALIVANTVSGVVTQLDQPPVGKLLEVCDIQLPGEAGRRRGQKQEGGEARGSVGPVMMLLIIASVHARLCVHKHCMYAWHSLQRLCQHAETDYKTDYRTR
jgi:hypothetical protein